jgi:hypothetical protein
MNGRDLTRREPTRHHATAKPTLRSPLRRRRPTAKAVLLRAAALSTITATTLIASSCGNNGGTHAPGAAGTASSTIGKAATTGAASGSASASASISPIPSPPASPSSDPGLLPQTQVLPNPDDPQFQAGVQALWQAIVQDDPASAHGFFFPLSAYLQVKAIDDPTEDYQDRLLTWYDLDIDAAHNLLGSGAASATLVGVQVPTDQAEWITPGVEYNKGSYYRVYGTRLTYQENGHTASFGIFSLISWRGEWYVVHLGPSTRSSNVGIVYDPED